MDSHNPARNGPEKSRSELAYQQVLEAIRSGNLKPGSRIRETELAARFGISRTPVREAIRRLESEALIRLTPHAGMAVAELDYQSIMELYRMREALEGTAAALAAQHASLPELRALRQLLEEEMQLTCDPEAQARKNKAFHQALYCAAHNRYLLKSLKGLQDVMALLGTTTYQLDKRNEQAINEHEDLLAALEARDPQRAEHCAREHIRAAQQARVTLINQQALNADNPSTRRPAGTFDGA